MTDVQKKILIASGNAGKIEEFRSLLADLPVECVTLKDLDIPADYEENTHTFEETVRGKVQYYLQKTGLATIADDGGLEIDALNGEPGVRSRRWAGHEMADEELLEYALERMKKIPPEKRGAQFRTVVAFAVPSGEVYTAEGILRGMILEKPYPRRIPGYPFRSIFYLPELKKVYVELTQEEDQSFTNHRRLAWEKLQPMLHAWLKQSV